MKTKIDLDSIRKAIEEIQRIRGCRVADITKAEIISRLSASTSNSTSGPLIAEALAEAALAEMLRPEEISSRLKAAFLQASRDSIDRATEYLKDQLRKEALENDELSHQLNDAIKQNENLKQELQTHQAAATAEIAALSTSLALTQGQLTTFEETKADWATRIADARMESEERKNELSELRAALSTAVTNETKAMEASHSQVESLSVLEAKFQEAKSAAELSGQKAHLSEERLAELKVENQKLQTKNDKKDAVIAQLQEKLLTASERSAAANAILEERGTSKPTPPKGARNTGKTG